MGEVCEVIIDKVDAISIKMLTSIPLHLCPFEIKDNDLSKGVTHKSMPSPY